MRHKHLHQSLKAGASHLVLKFKALPSSCWFGGGWHLLVTFKDMPVLSVAYGDTQASFHSFTGVSQLLEVFNSSCELDKS